MTLSLSIVTASLLALAEPEVAIDRDPGRALERPWTLGVELGSTSYDFAPRSFGPSLAITADAEVVTRRVFHLRLGPRLGYALAPGFIHGFSAGGRLTTSWRLRRGFTTELALGLGYRHHWLTEDTYTADGGVLSQPARPSAGAPGFETSVMLALGYDFQPRASVPIALLLGYEPRVLAPFLPRAGVPVFVATTVALQLRIGLNWPRSENQQ